jgi:hypothetical protein
MVNEMVTISNLQAMSSKYNLLNNKIIKFFIINRLFQLVIMLLLLFFYNLAIITGIFGTSIGGANFATIFIWVVWWVLLFSFFIPFLGRVWCSICPIPIFGDLVQRGSLNEVHNTSYLPKLVKNLRFPQKYRGLWISTFIFAFFGVFAGKATTNPLLTSVILLSFIITATLMAFIYQKRSFCKYICPIGGTIGLYSQLSPIELRVKDPQICRDHKTKNCLIGNDKGFGCNWMSYPGSLSNNMNCGLCFECIRTCDKDNVEVNLRTSIDNYTNRPKKIDEGYRAIVLLGSALLYLMIFHNPFSSITRLSNFTNIFEFIQFTFIFLGIILLIIPIVFAVPLIIMDKVFRPNKHLQSLKFDQDAYSNFAFTTTPLSLSVWFSFSLVILLNNWTYIVNVINDPFGNGMNLFNLPYYQWTPLINPLVHSIILGIVLLGTLISLKMSLNISKKLYKFDRNEFIFSQMAYSVLIVIIAGYAIYLLS